MLFLEKISGILFVLIGLLLIKWVYKFPAKRKSTEMNGYLGGMTLIALGIIIIGEWHVLMKFY